MKRKRVRVLLIYGYFDVLGSCVTEIVSSDGLSEGLSEGSSEGLSSEGLSDGLSEGLSDGLSDGLSEGSFGSTGTGIGGFFWLSWKVFHWAGVSFTVRLPSGLGLGFGVGLIPSNPLF